MSNFDKLRASKAPNLPVSPIDYSYRFFDQYSGILRLYFNELDNITGAVLQEAGGHYLGFPHICASDSTDQIATGSNVPTVVKWNTLDSGIGWALNAPGSATAEYGGIYKITYSLQFINTANAIHYATVWLKVNNVDLPNSSTIFAITARKSASPGEEGYVAAYSEVTFEVNAGDTIELYWATDQAGNPTTPTDGVYIYHDVAQTVPFARPAIPSAIGSITFVSRSTT